MKSTDYKKASTYYLVGNIFNRGMSFLTVPIFTRILSTSDYGIVTTYNSWITILSMVVGFALYMGIRAAFIDYKDQMNDFMSVATTFTLESGIVFTVIVLAGAYLLKINVSMTLIALCLFQGIAAALIQNYLMYLMMQYRYKFRTALMILPNLISMILSVIVILFIIHSDLYMGRIIPTALINISFGLLVVVLVYKKSHLFHCKEYLKYGLSISAPLVLHGIALSVLSQSDRTMITLLADANQTGIYSLIYNFSMLATVITTAFDGVWIPWFTNKYKEKKLDDINKLANDYVHLITCAMIGLILIGPEVVKLLASEKYWQGINIIPPVVLSNYFIFLYTFYVNVEHYHKKTPYITINTLIAAGVNVGLNFLFIPKFGYTAAAYTTLTAYVLSFFLHARYAKKLAKDLYPLKSFVPSLAQILAATIVFYVFLDFGVARWIITFVYLCVIIYLNKNRIREYFPSIRNKFRKT